MKTHFMLFCCIFSTAAANAEQICKSDSIPASTPDSQFIDNGDGTITDSKTCLMWKKCIEGFSGYDCGIGFADGFFTWKNALQQPSIVNNSGGFAGHSDWRLPSINELISIIEEQCSDPAINLNRFPNTPNYSVWSGSPGAVYSDYAWHVSFYSGGSYIGYRSSSYAVRLVRGGQ